MLQPKIAVIVSTFERPDHLRRSLLSIAHQCHVLGQFEVVVTDDGSRDHTESIVREFAHDVSFPVTWVTGEHHGFRLARCRNAAVHFCQAPYLLFTDGDCVLPPDHLDWHLRICKPNTATCGDCYRIEQHATKLITNETIANDQVSDFVSRRERRRLFGKAKRAQLYSYLRVPSRPRMTGNNIGVWRTDFEAINGFDDSYVGWGLEDHDFQRRLAKHGVRCQTILHHSIAFHLWHPPASSFSRNGDGTANKAYFLSTADGPDRCHSGFDQYGTADFTAERFQRHLADAVA